MPLTVLSGTPDRVFQRAIAVTPANGVRGCHLERSNTMNNIEATMEIKDAASDKPLSTILIGTWELLSREDQTHTGERRTDPSLGANPVALLFFDQQGHFAAQFMKRERGTAPEVEAANLAPNNSRARDGYDAYFGTYSVDNSLGTVRTRLVGALSPENVGQVFTRTMSVVGDELTIRLETASTSGEPIIRTLHWRRVG